MTLHDPTPSLTSRSPRQTAPLPHGRGSLQSQAGFTIIELLIVIAVILLLTAITVTVVTGISSRSDIRETENTMRIMETALSEWELASGRQITFGVSGTGPNTGEPCQQNERYEIAQARITGTAITGGFQWTGANAEFDAVSDARLATDRLWAILSASSTAYELIARVNPDFLFEETVLMVQSNDDSERTTFRFRDAWDNPILAILPGREFATRCVNPATGAITPNPDADYCTGDLTNVTGFGCPDPDGTIRTPFENRFGVAANGRIFFVSAGPSGRFGNLQLHLTRTNPDFSAEQAALAADNVYSYPIITEEGRPE